MEAKLIVHGGAWDIPAHLHQEHRQGLKQALKIGQEVLKNTDDSLKTVLKVIEFLEDFPVFDAGRGSFLNAEAQVEMDAGLMVGKDLSAGAVAGIQNVAHPIRVAELVRSKTQHVLLVGEGANRFARQHGMARVKTEDLLVGREKELYLRLKKNPNLDIKRFFRKNLPGDTVGAVAINSKGEIVAGTSTGGTPFKLPGRVGDSPVVGAGFYADDRVAGISCTGWGEGILRLNLARITALWVEEGTSPEIAAQNAVKLLEQKVQGNGGLILMDANGQLAYAYNTPFMAVGAATVDEILFVKI